MRKVYFLLVAMLMSFASAIAANPVLYLRGAISGSDWPAVDAYKFTENNGVYTLTVDQLSGGFLIADSNWSTKYGGKTNMVVNTDYTLQEGGSDMTVKNPIDNATLTFTLSTKTLRITGSEGQAVVTYQLNGQFTSSTWAATDFTEKNGKWEQTLTVTVASGMFGIKKNVNGMQDAYYKGGDKLTETNTSVTLSTTAGSDSTYELTAGKQYTFTFDPATGVLSISFEGEEPGPGPDPVDDYTYLFHSSIITGDWGSVDMTNENGKWILKDQVCKTGQFGIRKMQGTEQVAWIAADGDAQVVVNGTNNCKVNGTNFDINAGTYTFTFDPEAMTLTVTGTENENIPDPIYGYALSGNFDGGTAWNDVLFTENNGKWELNNLEVAACEFGIKKIVTNDDNRQAAFYKKTGDNGIVELNTPMAVSEDGQNFSIAAGTYSFSFDPTAMTLTVTSEGGIVVEYPENMYIIGNLSNSGWATNKGIKMENLGDGVYSVENVEMGNANADTDDESVAYFSLTSKLSENVEAWDEISDYRYGATEANKAVVFGTEMSIEKATDPNAFVLPGDKKYNMTVNLANMSIKVEQVEETAVETIVDENADAEVVYYNLQGVRVANPDKGIYIVVKGNTSKKVVF